MAKDDKKVKRGVYLYIDGKGITNDIKSINNEIKGLQRDIKNMTIGSEEYNRTMAKIKHLQGILKEHRNDIRGVTADTKKATFSVGKLADGFNRFGGVIVSVIGFLTGFALALRSIRDERNKLESSQAGLKALTGLDDESISWLTEQAKTLSTTMTEEGLRVRQSVAEILDAFMLVGSAKPELLGDKEALRQVTEEAMRLQAAAGDITLNQAVDSLTLSLNQYGAQADQAARYANVLAAGSKEGAANIASQSKEIRIAGTAAASANVSIEQTVGLIETLAYRGIKDEVAGTGLKKFFLMLQTGADETNPKIVGLDKALENLKNKKMDAGAIKKMFGEEGFNAASVIIQNTEMVNNFTKAITGTNLAYEQSSINSATAAAKLDQARNKMKLAAIELGEKLNPVLMVSTNMMTNVVKFLPGLIEWFQKWTGTIVTLLIPVAAYVGYLKIAIMYHATLNAITKVAATIKVLYAAATANVAGNLTGANRILTLFSANMMKNTTAIRIATAATYLFSAAKAVLTGNIKAARIAMTAFNAVCTKNMYVAIAVVVIALATALYKLATRTTEAEKATEEFYSAVGQERNELNKVYNQLLKTNEKTDERTRLINEFNGQFGKYLTNLLSEKSTVDDIKKAYREATVAMNDHYARELLASKQTEIVKENLNKQSKYLKESVDIAVNATKEQKARLAELISDVTNQTITDNPQYGKGNVRQKIYEQINREFGSGAAYDLFGDSQGWEAFTKKINPFIDGVDETIKKTNELKDELAPFIKSLSAPLPDYASGNGNEKCPKCGNSPCTCNPKGTDKDDKDKFAKVEAEYYQRISAIKQKYLADDTMTQEQYSEQMQKVEIQLLNDKLDIAGLEPEKKQEIADKILDIQIQMKEKRLAIGLTETKEILSAQEKRLQLELESTAKDYKKHLISRESFLEKIKDLQKKYGKSMPELPKVITEGQQKELEKYLEKLQEIIDKYNEMEEEPKKWNETVQKNWEEINKYTDASSEEMTAIIASLVMDLANLKIDGTESFKSLEDSGEAMFAILGALGKQFGLAMGEMLAGEEEAVGEFLKSTLNMVLTAIEQLMIAYIAQTTMRNIAEMGVLGLLKAAGEIALITAAFESVKGLVGNFYTGGYTGSGDWDQPQGIVHSNEFVANRYAVANPAVRPVLDLIDSAQRTGSVGNISQEDMAAVAGVSSKHKAGSVPNTKYIYGNRPDDKMAEMMKQLAQVLDKLKTRLDEPLISETYVTGKRGINQAMKEYNVLQNNISRRK